MQINMQDAFAFNKVIMQRTANQILFVRCCAVMFKQHCILYCVLVKVEYRTSCYKLSYLPISNSALVILPTRIGGN